VVSPLAASLADDLPAAFRIALSSGPRQTINKLARNWIGHQDEYNRDGVRGALRCQRRGPGHCDNTSTLRRTSSAASSLNRSYRSAAKRFSRTTFLDSA